MANAVKLDDDVATESGEKVDQDGGDDDLGDDATESFKDSVEPNEQWRTVMFTKHYFGQLSKRKWEMWRECLWVQKRVGILKSSPSNSDSTYLLVLEN